MGLGRTEYLDEPDTSVDLDPAHPWLLAWCGDIDITGHRRPASYFREIVFGLRREPYIAVFRPGNEGRARVEMQWAWSDTIASWTWDVSHGLAMDVEIYSDADEVEVLLNGSVIGRAPAGAEHRYRATFQVPFHPGTLTAIAIENGEERSRTSLTTAGAAQLTLDVDRPTLRADHSDLAFVAIELRDSDSNLSSVADRVVSVEVTGSGVLQAVGSARPKTLESFSGPTCTTFDGRALAIIRPTGIGSIDVVVRATGL